MVSLRIVLGALAAATGFAEAKKKKKDIGSMWTHKASPDCQYPPTYSQSLKRVGYGDKLQLSIKAESPEFPESNEMDQEMIIGKARIPIFDTMLDGMCEGEVRKIHTWMQPELKYGTLHYTVKLHEISEKGVIKKSDKVDAK